MLGTSSSFVIYDATEREDYNDDESRSHLVLDNEALLVPQIYLISQELNHDNRKKMRSCKEVKIMAVMMLRNLRKIEIKTCDRHQALRLKNLIWMHSKSDCKQNACKFTFQSKIINYTESC
ncbi:hypothetical protein ACKWTF_001203 [Chironomus riparius]